MPSVVAISFQASFDLLETVKEDEAQVREDTLLTLGGVCSCDPATNELSEIEVREWEWSLKSSREGGWQRLRLTGKLWNANTAPEEPDASPRRGHRKSSPNLPDLGKILR